MATTFTTTRVLALLIGLGLQLSACAGPQPIAGTAPPGPPPGPQPERSREPGEGAPDGLLQALCDRYEDCVVERNENLARAVGSTPLDLDAAREEARTAVLVGAARRWCQLRLGAIEPASLRARQACLAQKECGALSRCLMAPSPRPVAARSTSR